MEQGGREEHEVQVPKEPRPDKTGSNAHEEALRIQRGKLESSRNRQLHWVRILTIWLLWGIAITAVLVALLHFLTPCGWMDQEKEGTLYTVVTTSVISALMTIVITNNGRRE